MHKNQIRTHRDLAIFKISFQAAMDIFHISRSFPREEIYSLTDQLRRSSRSVSANIAEAFRKRRYEKAFIAKLSDVEAEAAETQVWLEFCLNCNYISKDQFERLYDNYDNILSKIIIMISQAKKWIL